MNTLKNKFEAMKSATVERATSTKGSVKGFYAASTCGALAVIGAAAAPAVFASGDGLNTIVEKFSEVFSEIYGAVIAVATIVATVLIAICLLLRMISKNPKTAEESTTWIKRIIITWFCLMLLSLFVKFGLDIISGSGANTATPWKG